MVLSGPVEVVKAERDLLFQASEGAFTLILLATAENLCR